MIIVEEAGPAVDKTLVIARLLLHSKKGIRNKMNYQKVLENARGQIGPYCKVCEVCSGHACRNRIPGPGAKGSGDTAIRNYEKWQEIRVNMDTIGGLGTADTSARLFGKTFRYPFFSGPMAGVKSSYGDKYSDKDYYDIVVKGCADNGIASFTGDGPDPAFHESGISAIAAADGIGIPTIKPWNMQTVKAKIDMCRKAGSFAIAMDIDTAAVPFIRNAVPPGGSKTVAELREIIEYAEVPFILKGVMTVKGAIKALEAGAAGIVVSNHGGRVLDQCPATAEVLAEIAEEMKGSEMKVLVDGGIRSGVDVFKALAMGADGALICRPFAPMVYGAGEEGVRLFIEKIGTELRDAMLLCGAKDVSSISGEMIYVEGHKGLK